MTFLFDSLPISNYIPVIHLASKLKSVVKAKMQKMFNDIIITYLKKNSTHTEGYYICKSSNLHVVVGSIIFYCKRGGTIAIIYVCDKQFDCPNDDSDEENCIYSVC